MATFATNYASAAAVTITLTSLADTAARQSTEINNTVTKALDYLIRLKTLGLSGSVGALNVYIAAQLGDGIRAGGVGATDAAFTGRVEELRWLYSVDLNGTTSVVVILPPVSQAFGGRCPEKFVIVVENQSGAALSATAGDHDVDVQAIKVDTG